MMKFNVLKKVIGISIVTLFVTFFSPYYVYSEAKNIVDELILDLRHADPTVEKRHRSTHVKDRVLLIC
jgi:hypothetical protein